MSSDSGSSNDSSSPPGSADPEPEQTSEQATAAAEPEQTSEQATAAAEQRPAVEQDRVAQSERDKPPAPPAPTGSSAKFLQTGTAIGLAVALMGGVLLWRSNREAGTRSGSNVSVQEVDSVSGVRGLLACDPTGGACRALAVGERVPAGSRVRTDFATRARLTLADGTQLLLERASELRVAVSGNPNARLLHGSVIAEVDQQEPGFVLGVSHGTLRARRAKFSVRSSDDETLVDVARGAVELENEAGKRALARAFEQGRLSRNDASVMAAQALPEALASTEHVTSQAQNELGSRGLGELRASRLGKREELSGAVRLTKHRLRVRIAGAVARTEVEEEFSNTTADVLEGVYRFPLPPDASIERLALEVDGRWVDGAFVDRERAASIFRGALVHSAPQLKPLLHEDIVWVQGPWRDPALLEWQRGGRFELKIFPIPRRGVRRIVLAYTQRVQPAGDARRYVYPLAHDPSGALRVDHFEADIEVRGHDPQFPVRPLGYQLERLSDGQVTRFSLQRDDFVPSGDLSFEYALPERAAELRAWAYRGQPSSTLPSGTRGVDGDDAAFVALALRPRLPRHAEALRRDFAIVVDSSRSVYGENFTRAKRLAEQLVRELDPEDRVNVLACHTECSSAARDLTTPGASAAGTTRRFLDSVTPDGASDPTRAIEHAFRTLRRELTNGSGREGRIIYIGDGLATVGPVRPANLEASVAKTLGTSGVSLTSVGVGGDSDADSLSALARGGAGVMLPFGAGQSVAEAAFAVLGAAYGHALSDIEVTLPTGLYAVAPNRVDAIPAGGETLIVARMQQTDVEGEVLVRGKLAGAAFEQRYPLRIRASDAAGNAFVPRLYAAERIRDLERDGSLEAKQSALQLSTRYAVASRYSSLLVLESEAMFHAFGLDRIRTAPAWNGDEQVDETSASAEDREDSQQAFGEADASEMQNLGGLGTRGNTPGEGHVSSAGPASVPALSDQAAAQAPAPAPAHEEAKRAAKASSARSEDAFELLPSVRPEPRRRMIPMRRIWERVGEVTTARQVPKAASFDALASAERAALAEPNRREPTRKLYALLALASELRRADAVAERWAERDPLDPEALTARADAAARRGERDAAIRLLGSVIDVRPDDVAAQRRLERLQRWAGRPELGCRHLVAAAELRQDDAELLADSVRCSRSSDEPELAERLLGAASSQARTRASALLATPRPADALLSGDLRVEASWSGSADLDLSLIDPDGQRVSWLGAPTRARITARDALSRGSEGLALRGAKAGEYLIEIVRSDDGAPVSGELSLNVAGTQRRIPFRASGTLTRIGIATIRLKPRLVPL